MGIGILFLYNYSTIIFTDETFFKDNGTGDNGGVAIIEEL